MSAFHVIIGCKGPIKGADVTEASVNYKLYPCRVIITQDSVDSCDGQNTSSREINIPTNSFIQKHAAGIDIDL